MPQKVEVGKFYLFGNPKSRHKSIVWVNIKSEKNSSNIYIYGRELKLESHGTLSQFFSLGSFLGPYSYHHFIRELTEAEVDAVRKIITAKIEVFFDRKDPAVINKNVVELEAEAEAFIKSVLDLIN